MRRERDYILVRSRYYKEYYKEHKRITITLTNEDYELLEDVECMLPITLNM